MKRFCSVMLAVAVSGVLIAASAWAAGDTPTTQQIIKGLSPAPAHKAKRPVMRGIRVEDPGNETTAESPPQPGEPGTRASVKPIEAQSAAVEPRSMNFSVHFAFGSAELTPEAREVLDRLGQALQSNELKDFAFRVAGHTDAVGGDEANLELSKSRAEAVKDYLVQHYGIKPARLEAVGFGKTQLLDRNNPSSAANRRVQVVNLGAEPKTE
jgi:outer membrane protein OmpA-like peptidoglycan-associated protein